MAETGVERRLTTVLAADVVGYSRLMAADEAGTLAQLKTHRKELIEPKTAEYGGRVVKLMGDGTLMEFGSVVDAVTFAVEVQRAMGLRNTDVPEDQRITYRIGINIGDIIVEGEDIYGDGVNIAARLEGLADPGGICVARNVYNQVEGKVDLGFQNLGEQEVKNIPKPVQVFRVLLDAPASDDGSATAATARRIMPWPMVAAGLAVLLIVAGIALWQRPWAPREEPASVENMAFPLPDKPSIAVLPFNNMSDDASQEYFADGMTEDLITDLSKNPELFVIARNSSFTYKGQQVRIGQVAEELGVRYVLEGSVRRVGNEVRINAQLIDATTGGHLWAERYDGTLADVFDLQDKVTQQIVTALAVSFGTTEEQEAPQPETESAEAYDAFLQGWDHYQRGTPEEFRKAIPFFRKAFDLDPEYGRAYAALAAVYWNAMWNTWNRRLGLSQAQSSALIQKYLQIAEDRPSPLAYQVSSEFSAYYQRKPERAITDAEHAIALDANNPTGHLALANALIKAERPTEAVAHMREAMRLDPYYPPSYLTRLGQAQFAMGEFEEAAATLERAASRNSHDDWNYVFLAAAHGNLGRKKEAMDAIAQADELRSSLSRPPVSLSELKNWIYRWTGDKKSLREGLSKAGVGYDSAEWIQLISSGEQGYVVQRATSIDVTTAKALHERGVVFVDVYWQWVSEHIPASHLMEEGAGELTETELLQVVAKNEEVVFCGGDARSAANASAKAVSWGFEKIYYFQGGTQAWKNAGYPVEGWKAE